MKKFVAVAILMFVGANAHGSGMCEVEICNKLERFSLSPTNWVKDAFGKTCFHGQVPKKMAVEGKELNSESRWYQGSFNPTKKSVTRINKVYRCD